MLQSVPISAPAHSIEAVPGAGHLSLATPKNSNVISLVDWRENAETHTLKQPDGEFFYGRCGFNHDGSVRWLWSMLKAAESIQLHFLNVILGNGSSVILFDSRGNTLWFTIPGL